MRFVFISIITLTVNLVFAAIPKNQMQNSAVLRGAGAIHGGVSAKAFALTSIKSFPGKGGKIERLSIEVGDPLFQAYMGAPGYFHVENNPQNKRIVINFAQTMKAKFNENTMRKIFQKSPFVASSELMTDIQAQTTSLVLHLRKNASLRAIPIAGNGKKSAQINLDLFEDSLLNSSRKK